MSNVLITTNLQSMVIRDDQIPESFERKLAMFAKLFSVSLIIDEALGRLYVAMLKQNPDTDSLIMAKCGPAVDNAFLATLRRIGSEGPDQLRPQMLESTKPVFRRAVEKKSSINVQDMLLSATHILAPRVITVDGVKEICIESVSPTRLDQFSAACVIDDDGNFHHQRNELLARAKELKEAADVRTARTWYCEDGNLVIAGRPFNAKQVLRMLRDYRNHLNSTRRARRVAVAEAAETLQETIQKNAIAKSH